MLIIPYTALYGEFCYLLIVTYSMYADIHVFIYADN
jgi:hypothetical protein